jgi:hypothetical protein
VAGGIRGCLWCILCQKRLRLSWKLDGCKPLASGGARQRVSTGEFSREVGWDERLVSGVEAAAVGTTSYCPPPRHTNAFETSFLRLKGIIYDLVIDSNIWQTLRCGGGERGGGVGSRRREGGPLHVGHGPPRGLAQVRPRPRPIQAGRADSFPHCLCKIPQPNDTKYD